LPVKTFLQNKGGLVGVWENEDLVSVVFDYDNVVIKRCGMEAKRKTIQSVNRALDILELLAKYEDGLTLTEIGEGLGYNVNTVSGLLNTLAVRGYVEQKAARGKWTLGPAFMLQGTHAKTRARLQKLLDPILLELHRESGGEAVFCSYVFNGKLEELTHIKGSHVLTVQADPGAGVCGQFHCWARGKVFLASLADDELEKLMQSYKFEKRGPNSIMDKATLISQIREIRENGFVATCIDEQHLGASGVAVGVFAGDGKLMAIIGLGIPTVRVTEETLGRLVEVLTKYGKRASEAIAGLTTDYL
jgi:IclR family KDG regulon transcriptional repressor